MRLFMTIWDTKECSRCPSLHIPARRSTARPGAEQAPYRPWRRIRPPHMATDDDASAAAAEAIRLVARMRGSLALTAALHELAQRALDAHVSVVLQAGPSGEFRVTSASGLDGSPLEAWLSTRRAAE